MRLYVCVTNRQSLSAYFQHIFRNTFSVLLCHHYSNVVWRKGYISTQFGSLNSLILVNSLDYDYLRMNGIYVRLKNLRKFKN